MKSDVKSVRVTGTGSVFAGSDNTNESTGAAAPGAFCRTAVGSIRARRRVVRRREPRSLRRPLRVHRARRPRPAVGGAEPLAALPAAAQPGAPAQDRLPRSPRHRTRLRLRARDRPIFVQY